MPQQKKSVKHNLPLQLAVDAAGGWRALARLLGIKYQSLQKWRRIPADRVVAIEKVTGVSRETLRPDLYR